MAAEKESTQGRLFLRNILPPRIEDAGLEYTELAADSIERAFELAASKVKSVATNMMGEPPTLDGELREDDDDIDAGLSSLAPGEGMEDACVDLGSGIDEHTGCLETRTGGLVEEGVDKIVDGKEDSSEGHGDQDIMDPMFMSLKLGGQPCVGGDMKKADWEGKGVM
eukprot:TRINITY_DN19697_c0_g1_i1.p1 TRINITY_DN19697_c0_g1~~TRINITY_DN19697_c0_g1_i1.p1  ORF type:complete len:167 (-),score=39.61 TRINITY_DN19697_c0_g1_i1:500-1000(-)